jgi:succinate-semialdehyde dehydrogenase/glutarate-semialdehyde dehydrogenase
MTAELIRSATSQNSKYPKLGLLINGEWIYDRPAVSQVTNPSDGSNLGPLPAANADDLDRALNAAARAFKSWKSVDPEIRADVLRKTAGLMRDRLDEIATVITLEQGKPLPDARNEVLRASSFLEWDAEQLKRHHARMVPSASPVQQIVIREPIGPVAAFTPWNVPISSPGRKLSGTIGAGCTVIIKAAAETPGTLCMFAQCFLDAGLPPGVLQVVSGRSSEISTKLIGSPVIRAVTLTGSVEVGKTLMRLAAEGIKPSLMELGGHAPVLIDANVDAKSVAQMAADVKFKMAGQICVSPSRFLVHEKIYEAFVGHFAEAAGRIPVGDGFAEGVSMGPLMNMDRVAYMEKLVADAVGRGAVLASGGKRLGNQGCFFAPTVLKDVPLEADLMNLEPFGPIAACRPVADMAEGLEIGNSLEFGGLAGYVFTNSSETADWLAAELECGSVSINNFVTPGANAPFGGHKESGIGTEGGDETFDSYTVNKTVTKRLERV